MLCPCREISGAYSASEAVTGTSWKYIEKSLERDAMDRCEKNKEHEKRE
jgi:hypothetical protein